MSEIQTNYSLHKYRIVILGAAESGKCALIIKYFGQPLLRNYDLAIEENQNQIQEVDGKFCIVNVFDTSGQEEFFAMQDQYIRVGDGFLLIYSVLDRRSFAKVNNIHDQILRVKDRDHFPMILVANKVGLRPLRQVTTEEGQSLAKELRIGYVEISTKDPMVNVDRVFHELIREIRKDAPTDFMKLDTRNQQWNLLKMLENFSRFIVNRSQAVSNWLATRLQVCGFF